MRVKDIDKKLKEENKMTEQNRMASMDMKKLVLINGFPLMLSLLISNLYNFVDSIFISHVSEKALTALALANPMQILISALGMANAVGLNSVISKALGEKNQEEVRKSASAAIWLAFAFWICLATLSLFILKPYFISQSGGDMEIVEAGISYLSIVMFASLGFMMQWVFDRFTIASGKSSLFLITLSSGAITNLILDPILIFGYFGIPAMGVTGAAIATVIGQFVGAFMGIVINKKYNPEIPIHFTLKPYFKNIKNILMVGVPSGIAQAMLSIMGVYVNQILIGFSSTAVAVYGACAKIQSLIMVPIWGFNNGLVPLVAYNYGAKELKRSYDSIIWSLIYEYGIFIVLFIFIETCPRLILDLFDASEQMMTIGVAAIRVLGISYIVSIFCMALSSAFQGFGRGMHSMVLTLTRQTILLFIFITILNQFHQIDYIWWAYVLSEIVSVPIGWLIFRNIKRKIQKEIA